LVGEFAPACDLLRALFKELYNTTLLSAAPKVLMHHEDMCEDGLSGVETRILFEVAEGAGALRAQTYVDPVLSDQAVRGQMISV
jgi:hypothetical protein